MHRVLHLESIERKGVVDLPERLQRDDVLEHGGETAFVGAAVRVLVVPKGPGVLKGRGAHRLEHVLASFAALKGAVDGVGGGRGVVGVFGDGGHAVGEHGGAAGSVHDGGGAGVFTFLADGGQVPDSLVGDGDALAVVAEFLEVGEPSFFGLDVAAGERKAVVVGKGVLVGGVKKVFEALEVRSFALKGRSVLASLDVRLEAKGFCGWGKRVGQLQR